MDDNASVLNPPPTIGPCCGALPGVGITPSGGLAPPELEGPEAEGAPHDCGDEAGTLR
jgi:hypothetical protein